MTEETPSTLFEQPAKQTQANKEMLNCSASPQEMGCVHTQHASPQEQRRGVSAILDLLLQFRTSA